MTPLIPTTRHSTVLHFHTLGLRRFAIHLRSLIWRWHCWGVGACQHDTQNLAPRGGGLEDLVSTRDLPEVAGPTTDCTAQGASLVNSPRWTRQPRMCPLSRTACEARNAHSPMPRSKGRILYSTPGTVPQGALLAPSFTVTRGVVLTVTEERHTESHTATP